MAKYIHLFDTASKFNEAYNGGSYEEPWVSYTEQTQEVNYNKVPYGIALKEELGLDDNAWGVCICPPRPTYPYNTDGWRTATQEEEPIADGNIVFDLPAWSCCSFEDLTYQTLSDYYDVLDEWSLTPEPYLQRLLVMYRERNLNGHGASLTLYKDEGDDTVKYIFTPDEASSSVYKHDGVLYFTYMYWWD